jgi:hypothetical protein
MRAGLSLAGGVLIGLAFLSLLGEMAARGPVETRGLYLSAEELWAGLAPESHGAVRAWFRSDARALWVYGIGPVLKAPAWLLLGLPGIFAMVYGRRRDAAPSDIDPDEVFLYEALAKRAAEEAQSDADDRLPEDSYAAAEASARAAEADLAREPVVPAPREGENAKTAPETDKPPPVNRRLS